MPHVFCVGLGFEFDIILTKYDQCVFQCLTVDGVDISKGLQGIFPQQGMKMDNFHRLGHDGFHLDHRVKQVFKQLEFLTFAIKLGVVVTGLMVIDGVYSAN